MQVNRLVEPVGYTGGMTLIEELDLAANSFLDAGMNDDAKLAASAAGALRKFQSALSTVMLKAPSYDWNADPDNLTKLTGEAFALVQSEYES
jgi:hypothetical protein